MSKKEVLVEYVSSVNSVIKQPLLQTQRIKFTSCDVSSNYLVFGATSGGVYIFNRYPCKFIKLIPNKDGAVNNLLISPTEQNIALSTSTGVIVIVQNCFSDSNLQHQIYTQHAGNIVTVMKWSLNDLYCGDSLGHISVISLTQLLAKALFQISSAVLMKLDSSIVQLDVYSHFLLVSSKTRTYLCDTLLEQYRQIGKKLRDGNFGACFSNVINTFEDTSATKHIKNGEIRNSNAVKIYCARPGSRLWEAGFDSTVVCTHQFRDSLQKNATSIIHLDEKEDSSLVISKADDEIVPSNFNFEKIFIFNGYILTFRTDGVYIFDIATVSLLYWTNYFIGVKDVKILDNTIYLWLENYTLKILTLLDIESFVLKVLSQKQYILCAQFCLNWADDIVASIDQNRLHVLKVLKEKLKNEKLLSDIEPLLSKVSNFKVTKKLGNGIHVVDNLYSCNNAVKQSNTITIVKNGEVPATATDIESSTNNIICDTDPHLDNNYLMNILNKQYQLSKINSTAYVPKFLEIIQEKTLDELKTLFDLFLEYSQNENESRHWITRQVLKCIHSNVEKYFEDLSCDSDMFLFIFDSFISVNKSSDACSCFYPLSIASQRSVLYYKIGCVILDKLSDSTSICNNAPGMYRYIIENLEDLNLPLLMQFNDVDLFKKFCVKFTYDIWNEATQCLIKLNNGKCLNCDEFIQNSLNLTWNDFAICMLHSVGGQSTLKLLSRHAQQIPSGELDTDFYQFCIFHNSIPITLTDNGTKYVKFFENIHKNDTRRSAFDLVISKYLKSKRDGDCREINAVFSSDDSDCGVCDISLKSVLLDGKVKLKCGHLCHYVCGLDRDMCNSCLNNKL